MADTQQAPEPIQPDEGANAFSEAFAERAKSLEGEDAPEEAAQAADQAATTDAPAVEAGTVEAPSTEAAQDTSGEPKQFDPWEGLSPEQRSHFEKLERSDKSNRGRVGALTKKVNTLLRGREEQAPPAAETGEGQGEQAPSNEQQLDDLEARLAKVAEDYGDVNGPIVEAVNKLLSEVGDLKTKVTHKEIDADAKANEEAYEVLATAHPDWQDYSPENEVFVDWLLKQPPEIQALSNSFDPKDTADLISKFKEASGLSSGATGDAGGGNGGSATEDKRRRQLEGSKDARGSSGAVASGVPNDFKAAFRARSAQIEKESRNR